MRTRLGELEGPVLQEGLRGTAELDATDLGNVNGENSSIVGIAGHVSSRGAEADGRISTGICLWPLRALLIEAKDVSE